MIRHKPVVVVKWGGGLITDKARLRTPRLDVLARLANAVARCQLAGGDGGRGAVRIILVHGAGSFGHLRARRWRLAEGALPAWDAAGQQRDAVRQVRAEMRELNAHVCRALRNVGLTPRVFSPHTWARNTGPGFAGDVGVLARSALTADSQTQICVTHGDVVDVDGPKEFGILSGDDLVVRLALETPGVQRLVFAVGGGVDGLLRRPPSAGGNNRDLIACFREGHTRWRGEHHSDLDVTGGIGLKATRGAMVARRGAGRISVSIVNGDVASRVVDACLGRPTVGTRIVNDDNLGDDSTQLHTGRAKL